MTTIRCRSLGGELPPELGILAPHADDPALRLRVSDVRSAMSDYLTMLERVVRAENGMPAGRHHREVWETYDCPDCSSVRRVP